MSVMLISLIASVSVDGSAAQGTLQSCAGRWYTEERKSIIEIYDCGNGTPCGRVAWIDPSPSNLQNDDHNHDPALRGRPLEGVIILSGFEEKDGRWKDGEIYNPKNGKTYGAKMHRESDDTLLVKGCVGPICKGLRWTRAE